MSAKRRILLIDPEEVSREALAVRLRTLGYDVATANDGVQGAHEALERPPSAVIADLAMPSISGAQLCRLLKAEPATQDVPVILRGEEGHRNRFWAEQTGALAYVIKGRMGDLVRAMNRGFEGAPEEDEFFMALSCDVSVRDRIAQCLDAALFDSVIAAEVRKLAVCECFDTLFDLFAQFVSQVTTYRWLSVVTDAPVRGGVHAQPGQSARALEEAIAALGVAPETRFTLIEDEDPSCDGEGPPPLVRPITFGDTRLGAIALAPRAASAREDAALLEICARELGGPLRTATLVEESRRLATVDALTGLFNRRAFVDAARRELARAQRHRDPLSVLLFDIDHFKSINDGQGHAMGDRVLKSVGDLLSSLARESDVCARWGGEEFVILLTSTDLPGGAQAAERVRAAIEAMRVDNDRGERIPVTASFGVATLEPNEEMDALVDRADRAMYLAKTSGRNRVELELAHENAAE
ncbi:MAG: diguanylate cyclase [Myxococcota bacterium]|nr:diguanylate cyclase [Myxococcota bacterium]